MPKVLDVGLFVGRFQPFHLGHMAAVKYALKMVKLLYIVVGSAEKSHSIENPFTCGERIKMIKAALDEEGIDCRRYLIVPLADAPAHSLWVAQVDSLVPKYEIVFSNDPLTLLLFREKGIRAIEVPYVERERYSATEVRRRMIDDEKWEELLPKSVAKLIHEIDGVKRLKSIKSKDKV